MAYLGKGLGSLTTANITVDKMTGNGSTATLTITLAQGVNSVNDISVFVSGVMQRPGTDYTLSGSTLTFTTAPASGLQVVAVSHGDSVLDCVADATAITASFDNNSVPDSAIGSLASSKLTGALAGAATNLTGLNAAQLTGALPAVAATNLTNLTSANLTGALPALSAANLTGISSYTKSASDPATNTNPTAVGAVWVNSTSGETYVCTDATTDANVWTNVGGGTGDVQPYVFGGTISGYTSGGYRDPSSVGNFNGIWKFSFATGTQNAAQIGIITVARHQAVASSSKTHGYSAGGGTLPGPNINVIDKFTFASDNDATDVGDTVGIINYAGGNSSANHGYICGNDTPTNIIQKYTFAADANSNDVANLSSSRQGNAGQNASAYGYSVQGSASTNIIDKFPFASDSDATDIGNLTYARWAATGQSSETHGYTSGGAGGPGGNEIDKFTFASDNDATTVGVLTVGRNNIAGQSSRTFGYSCGGSGPWSNVIDKFAFASDGDATDVGDLPAEKGYFQGHNY